MRYDELPGPAVDSPREAIRLAVLPIHEVLAGWSEKYGDRVFTRFVGRTRLFLNEPALLGQILDTENERYYKIEPVADFRPMVGQSVFISNGAEWEPKRRAHPFESPRLDDWITTVLPGARATIADGLAASAGRQIELVAMTRRLSFDVFCLAVFGRRLDDSNYRAFISMYDDAALRMKLALVAQPVTVSPIAKVRRDAWFARVAALVHGRFQAPEPSLLAWLATYGTALDEELLIDEISTILFAGVGPVAVTMASLLYELGRRPGALGDLREAGGEAESLGQLSTGVIANTVSETLRHWPTVVVLSRAPYVPGTIGDIEIDADIDIFMSAWALHRSPRVWNDPLAFTPERFDTEPAPWTFLPFGIGPRTCVGESWALFVLRLFTATLGAGWNVTVRPEAKYSLKYYSGFARPAHRLHGEIQRLG